jgi:hypothetical protein
MHFAVDPAHPDNQVITDIGLAERGSDGRVHFSWDFLLLKPVEPSANGTVLFDVINRGNRTLLNMFNETTPRDAVGEPNPGNGFLMRQGMSLLFGGWQVDAPAGPRLHAPEARDAQGNRLTGQAFIQYQLGKAQQSLLLSDAGHQPLPTADLEDQTATLTVREHPDAPPQTIERSRWRFARWQDGQAVTDENRVYLEGGFEPGKVYEIIYTSIGAPVIGLGFLATRDAVSYLKHGSAEEGNPLAGRIQYGLGFGQSMSGRYLREFLYLGLNRDEQGRPVFDGMFIHTGSSRRGEFNLRFGQPSTNVMRSPSALFPMTYTPQTDPVTGMRGGLLDEVEARGITPKIVATNTAVEYWWSGAALTHTNAAGTQDVEPPANVRIYHLASTQHGPGALPLSDLTVDGVRLEHPQNTVNYRPLMRTLMVALDKWVRGEADPPGSRYPQVADGTLVARENVKSSFMAIPGVDLPVILPTRRRLDFGPDVEQGIYQYPPKEGEAYPILVSAVDADGNEVAGIRHPDVQVPLATYTGWTRRHAESGAAGHFVPLQGLAKAFPRTAAEREQGGDPRGAIDERYPSREAYLAQVREASQRMADEGYLLAEDVELVVDQAGARYDAFHSNGA